MALSKVENPFTGQIIPVEFTGDEPTQQELASLYNFLGQTNEQSNTPLTKDEFIDKRRYDKNKSTFQTVSEFGEGMVEGVGDVIEMGKEAYDELPPGYQMILAPDYEKFFDAIGDIVGLGGRDFVRLAKTLGPAAMDKIGGYSEKEEIDREYKRYIENFDYHTKVRPAMLDSGEIEFKKIANFGAQFVDPFLVFPAAKLGTMAVRAPIVALQKAATKGAYATRSKGLVNTSKFLRETGKAVGKVDKGVEIIGKIGAYPSEMAARAGSYATRKAVKGAALGTGLALQGIGKLGAGVEKVASAPRKAVAAVAGKFKNLGEGAPGAAALTGQVTGAIGGVPGFLEAGIAEGIGILAKKVGGGSGQLLRILAEPASNKRFLYRVATSEKVSPQMRKAAMFAYSKYGTSLGDGAFNMLANGLSIGAINSALAGLAGEDARTAGAGFGAGAVIGGALPFGQRGMRAGKRDVARDDKSIDSHMANKLTSLQRESFVKLPKPAQVMLATLEEAGVGAPKVMIVEPKLYLEMLNKDRAERGLEPLTRAPKGHFQKSDRTIFINDKFLPRGAKEATEISAHEVGHDFIYQALGEDPGMLELILDKYKTTADKGTAYYFKFGPSRKATAEDVANGVAPREGQVIPGEPIGDPIYLSDEAVQIATDYNRIQRGISVGRDAGKLAQEIGADQFAMMFSKDPNAFNNFHPRLRRHIIDSARKVLTSIGVVKPDTGNPLSNPISKTMLKNPSIQRLFDNYGKARGIELDEKANLANDSITIQPKKGQSGEDRYTELFGGQGLSLRDARNLIVSNKSLIRQIKNIMKMYKDEPRDTWSVTKNGKFTGKNLLQDLRTIFTRNDPFGNVANILDALQEAINQRIGLRFGYRSGTKGKYQNPFKIRDVALYAWEVSGFKGGRPSLKVLGYNQAVVRSNIQVLVEKGYIKDPNKFMLDLEKQGQRALEDPEGRINPEGRDENVLMTIAFGLKESAQNIKSEGLRDLLNSKAVKKSFVSYDVEALAGLTKGKDKAFAFNYSNIRDNYNPFRQADENFYIPTSEADVSNILQSIRVNDDGFTMDLKARFPNAGFVVAPSKATEFVINQNKLDNESLRGYLETHAKMFEREGAHLGGWLKRPTGEYMLDVVFPLSYEDAVRHAMWGDQDAIFDLSTFNEIATRNETTKKVQPPEGFPESIDEILRQKPRDLGAAAERSFRDSSPIRDESIESIRRRAESSQSEVREPPPPEARGEEIDPNLFLPQNDLTKFGAAKEVENSSGWLFPNGQFVRAPYSSHEVALGRFMDQLPDSDPIKQKVAQAAGRTITEKALSSGLMRVKKDGKDLYFQGNLTPKMRGFIEKAGIEYEVNAIHDNTARGSSDRSNILYSPPTQAMMADMYMPAPTDLQARKNMQTFLKANGKPFFAKKVKGGYKPKVLFHRGKIGERITDEDIRYDEPNLKQFKEKLGDKPSWEFIRPTEDESKFLKDHFGMESKDAIYVSENLGGRFSNNFKTKKGKIRKFLKDDSDPVNELPDDTIRAITNISKVWDYENVKDVERVLKEVQDRFTTTEMFTYGWVEGGALRGGDGISPDSMRISWLRELPNFQKATDTQYDTRFSLKEQREGMVEFLNEFGLFDKYNIQKLKLLSDDNYLKEVQAGLLWLENMLNEAGNDIAILRGLADGNDVRYGSGNKYHLQDGDWSNESLIPIIESLGYEGMRNIDSDSGGDVPSKSVLIFDSKNIKLVHGKGLKNYGTFNPNDPDIRYMPALEDAKALVEQRGRVAEAAEDTFFGKMFPKMLRKVGGQLKPSTRNIREAARRAIEDTEVFLKENPQFADYYNADMEKVRALLDNAYNGIIDDEMLYYRLTLGLTSPGTSLPANVGDGLNIFNLKKQDGNLDKIKLGKSEKGNVVVAESPFQISGLTAPTKAKALKIVDRLEKEKGGIRQAVEFLEEGIPMKELHKFKLKMGFKGRVGKVGDIQRIVKAATGQDKLIPRMFIFGPKVGAYTLNAIGRHNYNTIDVWEARFIRSYFKGMFSKNTGLPANVDEHTLMTRFTEMFQEEYNRMTGQNLETSALQALRWFYMIDTAKKLGYTGASTNETISGYTERYLTRLGLDQGSGGQSNAASNGGVSAQAGPADQQFLPQPRQLNRVAPARPQPTNRFMMMPAAARAAVASGQTLDRFRN